MKINENKSNVNLLNLLISNAAIINVVDIVLI